MFRLLLLLLAVLAQAQPTPHVPGIVIDHSPQASGRYIGSPSIAILADGSYVATHDFFGPRSGFETSGITEVFRSRDRGEHWAHIDTIHGAFWSTLFVHRGALYLIGVEHEYGDALIRRSDDGGATWTQPVDAQHGRLLVGRYHCAPQPVMVFKGRIWRAMEDANGGGGWGKHFRAFMLSAPAGANLLDAANWTVTNPIGRNPQWLGGAFGGWLEGNAVATRKGDVVDVLRVDTPTGGKAAMVRISRDGKTASFDPASGFIDFPGGATKFTIRYDPKSRRYWSLTNAIPKPYPGLPAPSTRNTLALISSHDLKHWTVHSIVLQHPDPRKHAFQYADWQFDGPDLITAIRTAFDDGESGAHSAHDANYFIFYRVSRFRSRAMIRLSPCT